MKEKILILVKTYPTYSKTTSEELVCTAGINEQGLWRRIYPVPFRSLDGSEKYKKYQWVDFDIRRNSSDRRPESYELVNASRIKPIGKSLPTDNNWYLRKEALSQTPVFTSLEVIKTKAKESEMSLCQFKPNKIIGLEIEETERDWSEGILHQIRLRKAQGLLFTDAKEEIKLAQKIPYNFSYKFTDENDKESTLSILDWEIGALYWRCLEDAEGDEEEACKKVRQKYEGFINDSEIIFFLGTTKKYHYVANNPYLIIGVFCPKKSNQEMLI